MLCCRPLSCFTGHAGGGWQLSGFGPLGVAVGCRHPQLSQVPHLVLCHLARCCATHALPWSTVRTEGTPCTSPLQIGGAWPQPNDRRYWQVLTECLLRCCASPAEQPGAVEELRHLTAACFSIAHRPATIPLPGAPLLCCRCAWMRWLSNLPAACCRRRRSGLILRCGRFSNRLL